MDRTPKNMSCFPCSCSPDAKTGEHCTAKWIRCNTRQAALQNWRETGKVEQSHTHPAIPEEIAGAYRQGVEDGRIAYLLDKATNWLNFAKRCIEDEDQLEAWEAMLTVKSLRREAFHGARGIARVEIRQRLARLKGTDNG